MRVAICIWTKVVPRFWWLDQRCCLKRRHLRQPRAKEEGKGRQEDCQGYQGVEGLLQRQGTQGVLRQGKRATGRFFPGWGLQRPLNQRSRRQGRWGDEEEW